MPLPEPTTPSYKRQREPESGSSTRTSDSTLTTSDVYKRDFRRGSTDSPVLLSSRSEQSSGGPVTPELPIMSLPIHTSDLDMYTTRQLASQPHEGAGQPRESLSDTSIYDFTAEKYPNYLATGSLDDLSLLEYQSLSLPWSRDQFHPSNPQTMLYDASTYDLTASQNIEGDMHHRPQ